MMRYLFALILCVIALSPFPTHAQGLIEYATDPSGCPGWLGADHVGTSDATCSSSGMCVFRGNVTEIPCLHSLDNIIQTVLNIVNFLFGISGSILLLYFIIGGFFWVSSFGNEDRVKKGTEFMKNALIGFIVMVSAYAIVVTFGGVLLGGNDKAEKTLLQKNDDLLKNTPVSESQCGKDNPLYQCRPRLTCAPRPDTNPQIDASKKCSEDGSLVCCALPGVPAPTPQFTK